MSVPGEATPPSDLILYQTEDGKTRIQCRIEDESLWLTQAQMADLFQTLPQNITQHIRVIYEEGKLSEDPTCKPFLQVRAEGGRQVKRQLSLYSLPVILAVGFRVRSQADACISCAGVGQPEPRCIRAATGAGARMDTTVSNHDQP